MELNGLVTERRMNITMTIQMDLFHMDTLPGSDTGYVSSDAHARDISSVNGR